MPEGYTHVRTARKAAAGIHYKLHRPAAFAAGRVLYIVFHISVSGVVVCNNGSFVADNRLVYNYIIT